MDYKLYLRHFWALKPIIATVLSFILPIQLAVSYAPESESQSRCAYVIVVMALLWLTEAIPIPVTALMPIFLFPLLGVAKATEISGVYFKDTTMLFLGGLIIACALEESGLHIRISLYVMKIVGAQPMLLMAGLMATTWFLSMWISNTAATSMMLPIIDAVMKNIQEAEEVYKDIEAAKNGTELEVMDINNEKPPIPNNEKPLLEHPSDKDETDHVDTKKKESNNTELHKLSPELRRMAKAFALCVAYGANIGGIATLTGSPPNLVFKQQADKLYYNYTHSESDISFAKWMGFAFPLSVITAVFAWLWMVLLFIRCGCCKKMEPERKAAINASIQQRVKALGSLSFCEIEVLGVFVALVILWLFRAPPNMSGWGSVGGLKPGYVSDSTPCMLLSVLLFLLPSEAPNVFGLASDKENPSYKPILQWTSVAHNLPWGVIVLLGGGFAIAQASEASGLSMSVGNELKVFADLDMWVMNMLICLIVAGATNVTSNTASATLLMPILAQLALQTQIHPTYLMMSSTIACSFAFMLPVATPPNAIVFSTGYLTIPDMVMAGLPINILSVFILTVAINTWGMSMFDLSTFPDVFKTNATV